MNLEFGLCSEQADNDNRAYRQQQLLQREPMQPFTASAGECCAMFAHTYFPGSSSPLCSLQPPHCSQCPERSPGAQSALRQQRDGGQGVRGALGQQRCLGSSFGRTCSEPLPKTNADVHMLMGPAHHTDTIMNQHILMDQTSPGGEVQGCILRSYKQHW